MNIIKAIRLKQITIFLLLCHSLLLFSQEAVSNKNNITLSFTNIQLEDDSYRYQDNLISLQLEINRNITDYIGIGGYTGFGLYEEWVYEEYGGGASITYLDIAKSMIYGVNSHLHILPLLFKRDIPRFDLYISGEAGLISLFSSDNNNIIPERGHYFDYSLMGGGAIYLSKKLGVFVEAGYRNFKYHRGFNTKYGLTFRF